MLCKLYKVGDSIDHVSVYGVDLKDLAFIKKVVSEKETSNNTKPTERDIAERISRAFRNCEVIEIREDSKEGIEF